MGGKMATKTVNHECADNDAYNKWMAEFNVSSRYVKPLPPQERHHFDSSVYFVSKKKPVTFFYKFVTIVKSIF